VAEPSAAASSPDVAALIAARERVLERIAAACARSGRDPADVQLIAVSKTVPADRLRAAVAAGLTVLGENRVQEAAAKSPLVPGATWHLVGHLQSNKARRAVELFAAIHSVDSLEAAARLDRLMSEVRADQRLPVFLQVNVDRDPGKEGFTPETLLEHVPQVAALPGLDVLGLMTVGHLVGRPEDARPTFVGLRGLSERARAPAAIGGALSMGMSDDLEVAIEEGATHVRVGRALFGERGTP
jgi:pyridoxal phosphate enzyme (YggS family)